MANIKSQKKRVLTNEKARKDNRAFKSAVRKAIKKAKIAKSEEADNMKVTIDEAIRLIDKAQSKGVFKANKAAREKSRLLSTK